MALVVRDSLVEEGCKQAVVDYMMAEVGYKMAGEVECRTLEAAGDNLCTKQYEHVNNEPPAIYAWFNSEEHSQQLIYNTVARG